MQCLSSPANYLDTRNKNCTDNLHQFLDFENLHDSQTHPCTLVEADDLHSELSEHGVFLVSTVFQCLA